MPPVCRVPVGHKAGPTHGSPHLIPGTALLPSFDTVLVISTRHQRFTCVQLHGPHLTRSCRAFSIDAHHQGTVSPAARGGLMPAPAHRHRGALPHLRQSIQRCCNLLSRPTSVQDTQCRLTIRSTGPIAAGRHLGYKSLAQMPARRNRPVSSNVRPHILKAVSRRSPKIKSIGAALPVRRCRPPKFHASKARKSNCSELFCLVAERTSRTEKLPVRSRTLATQLQVLLL